MKTNDLLNKLGTKPNDGDSTTQSSTQADPVQKPEESISAATENQASGNAKAAPASAPSGDESSSVKNPDEWSKDSALKEVLKLREENKAQRLKYQEKLEEFKHDYTSQQASRDEEFEKLKAAQDELDKIKAQEEDKKRSLEDKVVHRESRINELEAAIEAIRTEGQQKEQSFKEQISVFEAQEAARTQVYQDKLDQELASIPDKFKETAELISRGAGDASQALVALNEARLKGLFEDKTVVVNHSVPGAKDGARSTKDRLEAAASAERDKMSSQQKIKAALKDIRHGEGNSAFRTN